MKENKICFISCVNDQQLYNEALYYIDQLEVPKGYEIECISIENANSMTAGYNKAMGASDAKYKVYMHQDVYIRNRSFINIMLDILTSNRNIGIIGLTGTKVIPVNGTCNECSQKYGQAYSTQTGVIKLLAYNEVVSEYEKVQAVDGFIMVTQYDIPWREDIFDGWSFYDISQSLEFMKAGYEVVIPKQEETWVIHEASGSNTGVEFEGYCNIFMEEYPKDIIETFIYDIEKENNILNEAAIVWRNYYVTKTNDKEYVKPIDDYIINKFNLHSEETSDLFDFDKISALEIVNNNKNEFLRYVNNAKNSLHNRNYEEASKWCFEGARYASENHPGFYTSPELEKILIECAGHVPQSNYKLDIPPINSKRRKVLHVLSEGYSTGGHTRLVKNWIEKDSDSIHSIITTWQIDTTPMWLTNAAKESGGWAYSLQQLANFIDRSSVLREIAYEWADIVVLHVHMFDPIPIMAFGVEGGPPVLFMNHGDHVFWIGTSIIDNLVNFRESGRELSKIRRNICRTSLLPLPLESPDIKLEYKNRIRNKLAIKQNAVVLLTIASAYKFKTFGQIHYIDILKRVLDRHNDAVAIVIGPDNMELWGKANKETKGRILPIGIQQDIEKYYAIADIYIDSYMFGSVTSALDGGLNELPVAALQNYNNRTLSFNDISYNIDDMDFNNMEGFVNYISKLISNKNYREKKGKELSIQIEKDHIYKWCDYLNEIYKGVENKVHNIYLNHNVENLLSNEDLSLALFQRKEICNGNKEQLIFPESVSQLIVETTYEDIEIEIQPLLHKEALERVRKKEIIKVAFFAIHSSVWKYDKIYQLMEEDPRFDPVVVICPAVNYGKGNMLEEMEKSYKLFKNKGYNVIKTYSEEDDTYLDVKHEIAPDIIFYTNPYEGLIMDKYYITNFKDTLTCYTQYGFYIGKIHEVMYNLFFHNILWRAFYQTNMHKKMAIETAKNKGRNVIVMGYPGVDDLVYGARTCHDIWKNPDENLKRIIWAPHHTIDDRENLNLNFSNFMRYYQTMIDIAQKYSTKIQIAFKPHPLLKVKLYNHSDWGKERTDNYYKQWEHLNNTQIELDQYIDLFNSSDAMILDSASFVAEYLYCGKPSLYTFADDNVKNRFNDFGKLALEQHYHAYNETQIVEFIELVCNGEDPKKESRREFYNNFLIPPNNKSASENIYIEICKEIWNSH